MKFFLLPILLFSMNLFSQEILKKDEIFLKDNLVCKVENSKIFTGKVQTFKHKNHLLTEVEFKNGVIIKSTEYYNGKEKIVCEEIYYRNNERIKEKVVKYSLDSRTRRIKFFDEFGNKILEENYKDGILIYSCPYLKNKKNGIVFSINEKGEKTECKFENGKFIE